MSPCSAAGHRLRQPVSLEIAFDLEAARGIQVFELLDLITVAIHVADDQMAGVQPAQVLAAAHLENPRSSIRFHLPALDPEVVSRMLGRRRVVDPLGDLTPREHEVLGLMAEGRSNQAIAEALVISERAVEKHVTSIFNKLHLAPAPEDHRRVLAVLAFLQS